MLRPGLGGRAGCRVGTPNCWMGRVGGHGARVERRGRHGRARRRLSRPVAIRVDRNGRVVLGRHATAEVLVQIVVLIAAGHEPRDMATLGIVGMIELLPVRCDVLRDGPIADDENRAGVGLSVPRPDRLLILDRRRHDLAGRSRLAPPELQRGRNLNAVSPIGRPAEPGVVGRVFWWRRCGRRGAHPAASALGGIHHVWSEHPAVAKNSIVNRELFRRGEQRTEV